MVTPLVSIASHFTAESVSSVAMPYRYQLYVGERRSIRFDFGTDFIRAV